MGRYIAEITSRSRRHISSICFFSATKAGARMPESPVNLICMPAAKSFFVRLIAPRARPLARREIEARQQAVAADIGDLLHIPEREDPLEEIGRELGRPLEQPLALIDVEGGDAGGAGRGMGGIGIAVEKLDAAGRRHCRRRSNRSAR